MTGPTVAVDLGEFGVAAAVDDGREVTELALDLAAVLAPDDGEALLTGREARRRAAADPSRLEPAPRRHVDEPTLLLGTRVVGVGEALGAVLAATVDRAAPALRGARPARLVLTHPASWGSSRREVLRRAGAGLGAELVLLPEPLAVAAHAAWMRPGGAADGPVAVLDVGARTARAAVVSGGDPEVLAERTAEGFGGDDADELLLREILTALPEDAPGAARVREVVAGASLPDRRHRQVLVEDVRAARERLSDAEQAEIPLPGGATSAWCSRGELEDVLREPCEGLVALLTATLDDAGIDAAGLAGLRLVGGLARTPLLGTLVHRELGVPPVVPPEPRAVVARGALLAVARRAGDGVGGAGGSRGGAGLVRADGAGGGADLVAGSWGAAGNGRGTAGVSRGGSAAEVSPGVEPWTGGLPLLPDWPRPATSRPASEHPGSVPPPGPGSARPVRPPSSPPRGAPGGPGPSTGPTPALPSPSTPFPARPAPSFPSSSSSSPFPARPEAATTPRALTTGPTAPVAPVRSPVGHPVAEDPDGPTRRIARTLAPSSRELVRTETPAGVARWSPRRRAAVVAAATVAVVVLVLAIAGLHGGGGGSATAAPPTVVSAFSHAYELPAGWVPDGTDSASRRSRIRPVDQPRGPNLIAVQESPLASPDPQSARAQLLAGFEAARSAGGGVSDLQPDTEFGGRRVATYRQVAAPGTTVEWVVVFTGATQLSVGCRHDDAGRDAVVAACARVVATLRSPP